MFILFGRSEAVRHSTPSCFNPIHHLKLQPVCRVSKTLHPYLPAPFFNSHRVTFLKALVTSLLIGAGASGGREGPIVQIGASVGSSMAQLFRLDTGLRRVCLASGAAAGNPQKIVGILKNDDLLRAYRERVLEDRVLS
ncbi:MAG: chloride channel protein, partial [Thermodesulfobacteriota bacterium]